MTDPVQARVRPDADVIDVTGHGGMVPLTFTEARVLVDQINGILSVVVADSCIVCGQDEHTGTEDHDLIRTDTLGD